MQTRSILDTSSSNLFTNIERLGRRDLLSYGQLSYDTILTSIQKQTIIASSSIISSSDNILIELVEELYAHTKQSSTLAYEALLLLPKVNEWTLLSMTNITQRKITMFLLMLSRFSVRFEESGNRLFLIADRK
ncbi:unnamed protein product [Rotaria sp. Silwood1]|nr:unnamed protein product [Rotaria sp. Silwood1]CAF1637814.1 unnamed protein product [Rotaria sp. Silwood1]